MQKIKITLIVFCLFWASFAFADLKKLQKLKTQKATKKQKIKPELLTNFRIGFSNFNGETRFIYIANQKAGSKEYFTIALEDDKNRLVMVAAPLNQKINILKLLKKSKALKSKKSAGIDIKIGKFNGLLNSVFHIKLFKMNNKYIPVLTLSENVNIKNAKNQSLEVSCFLSDETLDKLLEIFEYKLSKSKAIVKR